MDPLLGKILKEIFDKIDNLESLKEDWSFYDLGRVAENKSRNTNEILVYLASTNPEMYGEGIVEEKEEKEKFLDILNIEQEVSVTHIQAVSAKWIPMGSRDEIAPDVRKGERVLIYRYSDNDELFWIPTNLDNRLRRLETACWLFSADPDGLSNEDRSIDNSYAIVLSTHDKVLRFTTTNLNEEEFTYMIELDTDSSKFTIVDSDNNYIMLDSKNTLIEFHNKEGTKISLDKKNINGYAPEDINLKAENNISLTCGNELSTQSKTLVVNVDDSFKFTSGDGLFDVPKIKFTGEIEVDKKITTKDLAATGPASFAKPITANGITSSKPIKGPDGAI